MPAARRLFASGVLIIPPNKLQPELLTLNLPLNICITLGRVVPCYGGEGTDERLELCVCGGGGLPTISSTMMLTVDLAWSDEEDLMWIQGITAGFRPLIIIPAAGGHWCCR